MELSLRARTLKTHSCLSVVSIYFSLAVCWLSSCEEKHGYQQFLVYIIKVSAITYSVMMSSLVTMAKKILAIVSIGLA